MTHDELLAKIKENMSEYVDSDTYKQDMAFLAVLDLHKPKENHAVQDPTTLKYPIYCGQCQNGNIFDEDELYPCATIQAIEKELE